MEFKAYYHDLSKVVVRHMERVGDAEAEAGLRRERLRGARKARFRKGFCRDGGPRE